MVCFKASERRERTRRRKEGRGGEGRGTVSTALREAVLLLL